MTMTAPVPDRVCSNTACRLASDCARRQPRTSLRQIETHTQPLAFTDGEPFCGLHLPLARPGEVGQP